MKSLNIKTLYYTSIFLLMCSFYNLSFTWYMHRVVFSGLATLSSILFMVSYSKQFVSSNAQKIVCLIAFLWYLYTPFISPNFIGGLILNLLTYIPIYTVIMSSLKVKKELLKFITTATAIMLLVSLIGWILYILGVNLPHTYEYNFEDNFHNYINYYVFIIVDRTFDILPRFNGMFIEPGQMASVCVLLLLCSAISKAPKWCIMIIGFGLIISFSLAGWLVMLLGFLGNSIINARKRLMYLPFVLVWVGGVYYYAQAEQNSIINTYIFDRLVFDEEKIIVGNNRTHDDFDMHYEKFIESSDALWGIHKELAQGNNWTIGNAGYKVFIVVYGIVGLSLVLLLLFCHYQKNRDSHALVFLGVYLILGAIRSFWITPYWLVIFLIAIPLFHSKYRLDYENYKKTF